MKLNLKIKTSEQKHTKINNCELEKKTCINNGS